MKPHLAALLVLLASCAGASAALAEESAVETRLREQLRTTMLQLRELQAGQDALVAAKSAAERERDALKTKGPATREQDLKVKRLEAELNQAESRSKVSAEELLRVQSALRQANDDIIRLRAEQSSTQAEVGSQAEHLKAMGTTLDACAGQNQRLIDLSRDILDRYRKVGLWDVVRTREPLVGLKRVEIENEAQALEDRIFGNRFNQLRPENPPQEPPR